MNQFSKINKEKYAIIPVILVFIFLTIVSWNKYGVLITYDIQREVIVPYLISKGLVLYKDIFYFYCPLMPYFLALLIKMFGYSINLFYIYGLIYTFSYTLILYFISRQFLKPFGSSVVSILFLCQLAFFDLGTYILPYSYSSTTGVLLSTLLLIALLLHYKDEKTIYLSVAIGLTMISLFVKQDYMISCMLIFLVYFLILPFKYIDFDGIKSLKDRFKSYLKHLSIINIIKYFMIITLPAGLIYLSLTYYFGFENLKNGVFPLELVKSKYWSLVTKELAAEFTLVNVINFCFYAISSLIVISFTILLIYALLKVNEYILKKLTSKANIIIVLVYFIILTILSLPLINNSSIIIHLIILIIDNIKYPYAGINLWFIAFLIYLCFYNKDKDRFKLIFLLVSAIILSYRMFFRLKLHLYAFFYLPISIVVFVYLLMDIIPLVIIKFNKLSKEKWLMATKIFLILFSLSYILLDTNLFILTRYKVDSAIGTFYGRFKEEQLRFNLMKEAAKYVKEHTSNDDKIIGLPLISLIYPYSNRLPANKYYDCPPGTIYSKEEDQRFINEIKERKPKYILISSDMFYDKDMNKLSWDIYSFGNFKLSFPHWVPEHYHLEKTLETNSLNNKNWKIWIYRIK